LHLIIH